MMYMASEKTRTEVHIMQRTFELPVQKLRYLILPISLRFWFLRWTKEVTRTKDKVEFAMLCIDGLDFDEQIPN